MLAVSDDIDIDIKQVLQNVGYAADYRPSSRIMSLVNEYLDNAHHFVAPSYSYVVRDVASVQGSKVVIEGSITFESSIIAGVLAHCPQVAVFALTIGSHLEELVAHLAGSGVMVQAAVLDAIGSGAVEKVADFVQERVADVARSRGLCISRRYSPGYCDWDVSQQKMVFQAMDSDFAGIRLTENCLMLPQKSISGIIGIGPCDDVATYNSCLTCEKHDNCRWKR